MFQILCLKKFHVELNGVFFHLELLHLSLHFAQHRHNFVFLEFVHDVDLSFLNKDKNLEDEIKKLDGKKIIFTNGSRAHALNVTKRIGIDKLFDGIFDIRDCEFIPKPSKEPYKKLVENYKIEPQYCIFFEDIARNLKPAHELGMKTVWIKNDEPWAAKYSDSEFINYKTDNLAKFLKEINGLQ